MEIVRSAEGEGHRSLVTSQLATKVKSQPATTKDKRRQWRFQSPAWVDTMRRMLLFPSAWASRNCIKEWINICLFTNIWICFFCSCLYQVNDLLDHLERSSYRAYCKKIKLEDFTTWLRRKIKSFRDAFAVAFGGFGAESCSTSQLENKEVIMYCLTILETNLIMDTKLFWRPI